jgi:hypothetical protein
VGAADPRWDGVGWEGGRRREWARRPWRPEAGAEGERGRGRGLSWTCLPPYPATASQWTAGAFLALPSLGSARGGGSVRSATGTCRAHRPWTVFLRCV